MTCNITNSIVVVNTSVSEMYNYIDILKKDGLKPNIDFHFKYYPPYHNNTSSVEFIFFDQRYTTFYKLKWS